MIKTVKTASNNKERDRYFCFQPVISINPRKISVEITSRAKMKERLREKIPKLKIKISKESIVSILEIAETIKTAPINTLIAIFKYPFTFFVLLPPIRSKIFSKIPKLVLH